jgi:hypothetical protein
VIHPGFSSRSAFSRAVLALLPSALLCVGSVEAPAQTQPQGIWVGAPVLASPGRSGGRYYGGRRYRRSSRSPEARCAAQGKEKGLSGRKLKAFVADCVKQ